MLDDCLPENGGVCVSPLMFPYRGKTGPVV